MNNIVIKAHGKQYLSEVDELNNDLPHNCMFNKRGTGCGGTTVALENDQKYVIAVPTTNLIKSKVSIYRGRGVNILGIYSGGDSEINLMGFTGDKIMVTYDSLHKLSQYLDLSEWRLLVDESHKTVDAGEYRGEAIDTVMSMFKQFKSYCFMTATPVGDDALAVTELADVDRVSIDWGKQIPVNITFTEYDSKLADAAAVTLMKHHDGEKEGNPYVFINSIESIKNIVRKMIKGGFTEMSDIRILCSDDSEGKNYAKVEKITEKCNVESLYISRVEDITNEDNRYGKSPLKPKTKAVTTFLTSTCFEGVDIFDEMGYNYIVVDGYKKNTKIDILTTLPQIVGRVRNSNNKDKVELLFKPTKVFSYAKHEKDKFIDFVGQEIENVETLINAYKAMSEGDVRNKFKSDIMKQAFVMADDTNEPVVNKAYAASMIFYFDAIHTTYYVSPKGNHRGITEAVLTNNGKDYDYKKGDCIEMTALNKVRIGTCSSFPELMKQYIDHMKNSEVISAMIISKYKPEISEAYNALGEDKIKSLKYRKSLIEKEMIIKDSSKDNESKVSSMLDLRIGGTYTTSELKQLVQSCYDEIGLSKKAKGNDIGVWYMVKQCRKRVGGKPVSAYRILVKKTK